MNRTRQMTVVIVVLSFLASAPSLWAQPIKVFIMAGQSNMIGSGNNAYLPTQPVDLTQPQPDVKFHYWMLWGGGTYAAPDWTQMENIIGVPGYGSEITFGRSVTDALPDAETAIIKVAASGTGIDLWNPDRTTYPMLYASMQNEVSFAMGQLVDAGYSPEIAGFVWVQGDSDAEFLSEAELYEQRLTDFFASVRQDWNFPDMPIMLNQYHEGSIRDYKEIVRQAEANVAAADPFVTMVNMDDQALKTDGIHLDSLAQVALGYRLTAAYLQTVGLSLAGDFNGDGITNLLDIGPFVLAITDPAAYAASYPGIDLVQIDPRIDGHVNTLDIPAFLYAIENRHSSGTVQTALVPEPASLSLLLAGMAVCLRRRRRAAL